MLRTSVLLCCLYFLVLTPRSSKAMTDEQKAKIKEHFMALGVECMKDFPISETDIQDIKNKNPAPAGEGVPCFMACVMRKIELLDAAGNIQKEHVLTRVKEIFNDEEEVKRIEDYLHTCYSSVNDVAVTDGEKGCQRAMLAYKCMLENRSKFGFDM